MLDLAARRPTVSNPALQKRRGLVLDRVTMRPQARAPVVAKPAWRAPSVMAPVAAAALMAVVPLAHAGTPDPSNAAPPIEVALAPEPLEMPPKLGLSAPSVADIDYAHKLEGIKANPYEQRDAPRIVARSATSTGRPRIVRKVSRKHVDSAGPMKVSDLKANPYD